LSAGTVCASAKWTSSAGCAPSRRWQERSKAAPVVSEMTETTWREFGLHIGMPHLAPGGLGRGTHRQTTGRLPVAGRGSSGCAARERRPERCRRAPAHLDDQRRAGPACWPQLGRIRRGRRPLLPPAYRGIRPQALWKASLCSTESPFPRRNWQTVRARDDLAQGRRPWAYLTHGFISCAGGGGLAKLEAPEAFLERPLSELPAMPAGITEHLAVERSGAIDGFPDWPGGVELPHDLQPLPFDYAIQPESDINTADVVYCARIPAIMASGERRFLRERLLAPLSEPLVACLATQHRRLYYFANASREEKLHHPRAGALLCAGRIRAVPCAHRGAFPVPDRRTTGPPTACSCRARWSTRPCACRGR